jgi:NTP pyrophosphatase (non-canonical NTP hydrolase)
MMKMINRLALTGKNGIGVEDELADIMIRVMALAAYKGINLESHIKAKMRYNSLREYKHGKKYRNESKRFNRRTEKARP